MLMFSLRHQSESENIFGEGQSSIASSLPEKDEQQRLLEVFQKDVNEHSVTRRKFPDFCLLATQKRATLERISKTTEGKSCKAF